MANQRSVSETRATDDAARRAAAGVHAGSEPITGTWSHAAPWNDPSVTSRRLTIMAGVGLGFLAIFAIAGGLARNLGSSALSCATGAECSELGVRYAAGSGGVEQDPALSVRLFQRACDLGDAMGCNQLGVAFESGQGVGLDYERAMDFFSRACSGGFADGCNNQGALYEHGRGVTENLGDAQRLYTQACRHGSGLGCSNLGALYEQGRGVPADRQEAARLFQAACKLGSSVGCNNVLDSTPVPLETIEQTP